MTTPVAFDSAAARATLGVAFRSLDESVRGTVESMIDGGFVKARRRE